MTAEEVLRVKAERDAAERDLAAIVTALGLEDEPSPIAVIVAKIKRLTAERVRAEKAEAEVRRLTERNPSVACEEWHYADAAALRKINEQYIAKMLELGARADRYLAAIREWVDAMADMNPDTMSTERCHAAEAALHVIAKEARRG